MENLKTLQEKEKMLVTSIFSISHNVFYPSQPKQISIFQLHLLWHLQMLSIWTSLQFRHLVKSKETLLKEEAWKSREQIQTLYKLKV